MTNSTETTKAALTHYVVDARASRFTVQAFATGLLSTMGHNPVIGIRTFSGDVRFGPEAAQGSAFHFRIQASSLTVQDDISDKDRREMERTMNEQILEIAKYPEIIYEAPVVDIKKLGDSLYSATLDGDLTLHGVSRKQQVIARVAIFGAMLRASGDFTLNQSDYQIQPFTFAGGALKLKDQLKFSFEMVAREQQ